MKKLSFVLMSIALVALASCGDKGITPVTEKIDGPLGTYFEVVSQPYQANEEGFITFDIKRVKDGMPQQWEKGMTMGTGDNSFEASFKADFLDADGKVCASSETDLDFDGESMMKLFNLKAGETGTLAFGANTEKAKKFKLSSDFIVNKPTLISLSGNIGGNMAVCMSLNISSNGNVKGAYYYKKSGPKALLYLKGQKRGNNLELMEYNKKGKHTGEYKGAFTGTAYTGEFEAYTGKTYDFDLKEDKEMEFIDFTDVDFSEFWELDFYVREKPGTTGSNLSSADWDEILNRYESLVNKTVKLMSKAKNGDINATLEMASVAEEMGSLSELIESAEGSMSTRQANRFASIQMKLANAAL